MATTNHYDALGIAKTATEEEIRSAWKKAAKENHPDLAEGRAARGSTNRSPTAVAASTARFVAAREAYDALSDPARRAAYDRELERPRTAWDDARDRSYTAEPDPTTWQRGDPYPGGYGGSRQRERAHERPTTRYAEAAEDPDWWRKLYEPRTTWAPSYNPSSDRRVDFDLDQVDLELGYAERFAFDRAGVASAGRRTKNPFRSMFRNGGKLS